MSNITSSCHDEHHHDLTYPFTYPWFANVLFLVLMISSFVIEKLLLRTSNVFRGLDNEKQRNVITYTIEIVVTFFAFCIQLYGGRDIIFSSTALDEDQPELIDEQHLEWATFSLLTISILYVWELIYRPSMRWPLLMHHILTLLMIQLVSLSYSETNDVLFLRFAVLMGFHATTEQLSFVALLAYRLDWFQKQHQATLFTVAAYQTVMVKTVIFFGTTIYFFTALEEFRVEESDDGTITTGWYIFWKTSLVPLHFFLYIAQVLACKVLFFLSRKCAEVTNAELKIWKDQSVWDLTVHDYEEGLSRRTNGVLRTSAILKNADSSLSRTSVGKSHQEIGVLQDGNESKNEKGNGFIAEEYAFGDRMFLANDKRDVKVRFVKTEDFNQEEEPKEQRSVFVEENTTSWYPSEKDGGGREVLPNTNHHDGIDFKREGKKASGDDNNRDVVVNEISKDSAPVLECVFEDGELSSVNEDEDVVKVETIVASSGEDNCRQSLQFSYLHGWVPSSRLRRD